MCWTGLSLVSGENLYLQTHKVGKEQTCFSCEWALGSDEIHNFFQRWMLRFSEFVIFRFGSIQVVFSPVTFYWSVCTKSEKWAVKHICVNGINCPPFYDFSIAFRNCSVYLCSRKPLTVWYLFFILFQTLACIIYYPNAIIMSIFCYQNTRKRPQNKWTL